MRLNVYYTFVPTLALAEAARQAKQDWALEPEVWVDVEHDRTGRSHSQAQVEQAFWTVFLAKLVNESAESHEQRNFRELALQLGLLGCWSVHVTLSGGPVEDLLKEAKDNEELAKLANRP